MRRPASSPVENRFSMPFQARLEEALGVELLRECDRRAKAHPLFYTLGVRQVGRAAADGWRKVIRPHLSEVALTDSTEEWVAAGFADSPGSTGVFLSPTTFRDESAVPLSPPPFSPLRTFFQA